MRPTAALLLLAATTGAAAQDSRDTLVPRTQMEAVVRDVAGWHDSQHPECRFTRFLGSTVIEADQEESTEKWTIVGCDGRQFSYQVFVMSQGDGAVADMVSNLDDAPGASKAVDGTTPIDAATCAAQRAEAERLLASSNHDDVGKGLTMVADIAGSTCPETGP